MVFFKEKKVMAVEMVWQWLPMAVLASVLSLTIYVASQQLVRMGGNEPQIAMAEDAARALSSGQAVESVVPSGGVEISASLSPYMILFNEQGSATLSSGALDGKIPEIPIGALEAAKRTGENRITWQPRIGVRSALVILPYHTGTVSGFVAVGRSLREVERQENQLLMLVAFGWLASLIALYASFVLVEAMKSSR